MFQLHKAAHRLSSRPVHPYSYQFTWLYLYCNRITLSVVLLVSEGSTNETFVCCSCGQLTNRQKKGNRSIHKSAVAVAACVEGGFSDKLSLPFPLLVCKGCAAVVQNAVHMARWGLPSCSAFSKNVRGRNAATEATSVISHRGTTLRDALNKMMEGFVVFFVDLCIAVDHWLLYWR